MNSLALPLALSLVVSVAIASPARAGFEPEVRAAYQDSVEALDEVEALIRTAEDDFTRLNDAAVDLHQRQFDAAQTLDQVIACGDACRVSYPMIMDALINFETALDGLNDYAAPYGFYMDWCCESVDAQGNANGCVQPSSHWVTCLGICWSCSEGWSNEDGSLGCNGAEEQECPL